MHLVRDATCPQRIAPVRAAASVQKSHASTLAARHKSLGDQTVRMKSDMVAVADRGLYQEPPFLTMAEGETPSVPPPTNGEVESRLGHHEDWMVNLRGEPWLNSERSMDWYTGKAPLPGKCPGVNPETGKIQSLPMPNLAKVTRKAAQDYFDNSWTISETLFAGFKGEEPFYRPPVHGLRHPQIFYYGHTPCLYVNKLRVAGVLDGPVNEYFESIFEVGVDEMLWDDMHKNDMVWPKVSEVHAYRKAVYQAVSNIIATHPSLEDNNGESPVTITWDHPMWSLFMGFEHERIHVETSSVLFRETPLHLMQMPKAWPALHPTSQRETPPVRPSAGIDFPSNSMIAVKGGTVDLGKPRDFPSYGWDNEYGHRSVEVPDFKASRFLITNGDFWHFVNAGGYRTQSYWSEDGWGWRKHRNMKWPFFWKPDGPEGSMRFKLRNIFEQTDMQWDWPATVNYHEARAYCAWKSEQDGLAGKPEAYRVITEAEHHLIRGEDLQLEKARKDPSKDRTMAVGGDTFASGNQGANLNLAYGSESPVDALPASSSGHHDAMGNVWEWTEDHFNPLEGFKVHSVYDDFSSPCFDGRHHMIMGGSFASMSDNGGSLFCRYHFRPHFLQHSGFRLVSSKHAAPAKLLSESDVAAQAQEVPGSAEPYYETDDLLSQYMSLHFPSSGSREDVPAILPHDGAPTHALGFPQRVAQLLVDAEPTRTNGRALDLGCAVGGSSFALASAGFDDVIGIDFSESFIRSAERMKRGEAVKFRMREEGDLRAELQAVHEPNVTAEVRDKITFRVGDACKLKEDAAELGTFDGAVLANLLCRLPDPLACLDGLQAVINKGGVVVIVTPFSWLEQFTKRSSWLGGYVDAESGATVRSKAQLQLEMEKRGFVKKSEKQMPLLIKEHQRKYQYIVSEATVWRKAS